jgi:phosphatidylserine/phosphatidylglycerophosphate/cardiolipin synthase-like enzyme
MARSKQIANVRQAPAPVTPAVQAILVVDNWYLPSLLQLLDHATERVDFIAYSFSIGAPKNAASSAPLVVAQKLVEVQRRGVQVRVYMEGRRETAARNAPTARMLEDAGVQVRWGSTHAKGVCVDRRVVLFGSTNLTTQSLTKNIETNLVSDDASVSAGFNRYFDHLWNGGTHGGVTLDAPMLADGAFASALIDMIDAAQERIDFAIYFFHHSAIQDALIGAHSRGVDVRGLIHNHNSFAMSYVNRTRGTVARLRAGGLTDLHYGPTSLFTHAKLLVRDREEVLMGTGNWLHEDIKIHPQLAIRFKNPTFAQQLTDYLDHTIEARGASVR